MEKVTCPGCGKKFHEINAMEQHRKVKHSETKKESKRKIPVKLILGVIVVIASIVGILMLLSSSPKYVSTAADTDNVLGAQDAPVTIVEYSDFQCPFCGKFYKETEAQIISEYVDTGKVKFIYKHFPISSHQYAQKAAEASECAADQGKFWEYHNKLFEKQPAFTTPALKQYASDVGLDRTKFDACLDSGTMASRVSNDLSDGQSKAVRSTPSFFINTAKVEGAQPFSVFKQTIDSELNKS